MSFYKPLTMRPGKLLLPFSKYLFRILGGLWYFISLSGAYIISGIFKCKDQLSIFILQFRSELQDFISFKAVLSLSKWFLNNNYALSHTLSGCSMSISLLVGTCLLTSVNSTAFWTNVSDQRRQIRQSQTMWHRRTKEQGLSHIVLTLSPCSTLELC